MSTASKTVTAERPAVRLGRRPALLLGASALLAGCLLNHPGASSLAFVEVEGASPECVRESALKVFSDQRYAVKSAGKASLVFVRDGTPNDHLQYGRLQQSLVMRVHVTLEPFGPDRVLLCADAYADSGGNERTSVKIMRIGRRPYMVLLRQVKATAEARAAAAREADATPAAGQPAERPAASTLPAP